MADKKAKSKEKKSSGNKKFLTVFGVLCLIAIIVVIVLLVIPANSYDMVETLKTASTNSFLMKDSEIDKFNEFKSKISGNSLVNYYSQEMSDIIILTESINDVIIYYNQFMLFANDNNVLKDNHKIVKDNFELAFDKQDKINTLLTDISKLTDTSASYLQNAMVDLRINYYKWLDYSNQAIKALSNCYQGCFDNSIINNNASTIILNTINDYLNVITKDFKLLVGSDVKGNISSKNYNYSSHGKILYFQSFVDSYININYDINNYIFTTSLQDKYTKINKFFETYEETNFYNIIDSISSSSDYAITKTYDIEDSERLYDVVKEFLDQRG